MRSRSYFRRRSKRRAPTATCARTPSTRPRSSVSSSRKHACFEQNLLNSLINPPPPRPSPREKVPMPMLCLPAGAVFFFFPPAGKPPAQADPDHPAAGGATIPAGWHVRTEPNRQSGQPASLENVKFSSMGDGLHTTVGPAAIYWRDRDTISGNYHVVAKMTQMKNPAHPEAFGIFIGGKNLADSAQTYTYFLVRPIDGKYSIRRRTAYMTRPTAVVEWTANDAVTKADT